MCAQLLRFSNGLTNQFGVSTVPLSECGGSEFGFGLGVWGSLCLHKVQHLLVVVV